MDTRKKKFGIKTTKALLMGFVFIAIAVVHLGLSSGLSLQTVNALTTANYFNTDVQDFATLRSSNFTKFPSSQENWSENTDADAGDTVSLTIYYHNSSQVDAQNVKASISVPTTEGTDIVSTGTLGADNFATIQGLTTIHLSSFQSLSYIPGSAKWYPNQTTTPAPFLFGQSGDEIVTTEGVNVGDVAAGWETQGSVVARFKVSQNSVVTPPKSGGTSSVDLTTNNASQGPYTLSTGESFSVDWISSNVTNCSIALDGNALSGVEVDGSLGPVDSSHPFYPSEGGSRTFVVTCEGLSGPVSDSIVINRSAALPPQTLPDPQVTAQTSSACGGVIDLFWNAVPNATGYSIYRDSTLIASISGTTFSDTGLNPVQSYSYTVKATSVSLQSPGASQITTNPSQACAPIGTSTVDITANGSQGPVVLTAGDAFTVDWVSSNVTNCTISSDNFSSGVASDGTLGVIDSTHPYYPSVGSSRTFLITCAGLSGAVSDSVQVTIPSVVAPVPSAPTVSAVTSSSCGGNILITWNSVQTATSYKVFQNGSLISQVAATSFESIGLTPGQSYSYTVKANNTAGDSVASNSASATSSAACINNGGSSTVDITANGSQGPVTLTVDQPFTIDWISSNATNCVVDSAGLFSSGVNSAGTLGVIDSQHSYYPAEGGSRTFNINCVGLSGNISDSVTVIRPLAPQPPVAPVVSSIDTLCTGKVTISWNSVPNATSYKIFRNGVQISTSTAITYSDTGLASSTLYTYSVKAANANGDSGLSNFVSTTIPSTCDIIPTAPTIFASTGSQCGGEVFVSWNAVSNASSYKVFRNGVQVSTSSNLSFTDTGLTPGQSYSYTVKANNTAGDSVASNSASATSSAACLLPPQAPVLTASTGSQCGGTSNLSWTSISNADSYYVYRGANLIATVSGTSFTDTGLTPGVAYTYSVKGHNTAGDSVSSNLQTVNASVECPLPTPTVSLVANPGTISQGQNSTLSWSSTNSTACSALWTSAVATSGNQVVSPATTTTYSITCTNGVTNVTATATVTVTPLPPQCVAPTITSALTTNGKVGDAFSYNISATSTATTTISYSASSLPDGLTFSGNTISGTPTHSGTFTVSLTATNSCGSDVKNLVITIAPGGGGGGTPDISVTLTSNPGTIFVGATSTLTWTSSNATACSATWTTATSTSGSQIVSPATTTAYTINCSSATKSGTANAIVVVKALPNQCVIPNLTSPFTANGKVGEAFTYTFSAAGSSTPTFVIGTAQLPAGLSFSGNTISGIPTASGVFTVPVAISSDCGAVNDNSIIITISPAGGGGGTPTISVTLTANPNTIAPGATSTLTWTSSNATACSATWTTATSTSGSMNVSPSGTTSYDINCTNGSLSATSTAVVTVSTPTVVAPPSGGGGGGGSSSGSRRRTVPTVLGTETSCEYLKDYLHIGWINDPVEVIKLQVFLKELEGFKNLQITGTFDQPTFDAVSLFQVRYQPSVLTPWGYAQGESTGYVYILTKKRVNEIFCQTIYPLNTQQEQEIEAYRAFLKSLREYGITVSGIDEGGSGGTIDNTGSPVSIVPSLDDFLTNLGQNRFPVDVSEGKGLFGSTNLRNVAAAVFAGPQGYSGFMTSILVFLAMLLAIFVVENSAIKYQNRFGTMDAKSIRVRRTLYFIGGLILALLMSLALKYYVIVLPTLILIIVLSFWLLWYLLSVKSGQDTEVHNNFIATPVPAPLEETVPGPKLGKGALVEPIVVPNTEPIIEMSGHVDEAPLPTPDKNQPKLTEIEYFEE